MLNTILRERARVLTLTLILSLLLTATAVFAATKLIEAKKGGEIDIDPGVVLEIRPNALDEDTEISADVVRKKKRVHFKFEPKGLVFNKPAWLGISYESGILDDVDDFTLYGEDGSTIEPRTTGQGMIYSIEHFSIYYFRRR